MQHGAEIYSVFVTVELDARISLSFSLTPGFIDLGWNKISMSLMVEIKRGVR